MRSKSRAAILTLIIFIFFSSSIFAQSSINRFLTPSDTLNKKRVWFMSGSSAAIYGTILVGLNQLWYANYPRSSFHFFNDGSEWREMDKAGHIFTSYFEGMWSTTAYEWTGMNHKTAIWVGGSMGLVMQSTIEILDGFSSQWGFSLGDYAANSLGTATCISQNLLWDEQRIQLKVSSHFINYQKNYSGYDDTLQQRVEDLYGTSYPERFFKDYNAQTYWASANIASFISNPDSKFPKWLNVAVGYGSEGMLGARSNGWFNADSTVYITRNDIPRVRQFYLAPDIDFTKIKTNSQFLKLIFGMANAVKFPAPALQIDSKGKLKLYPLYL